MDAPSPTDLLTFLPIGYLITIAFETPILLALLSKRHSLRDRLTAGVMLTACTYPIVVLVLPELLWRNYGHTLYITIAETFAPLAECALFYCFWIKPAPPPHKTSHTIQDFAAITLANLVSWLGGGYIVTNYLQPLFQ